MKRKLFLGLSFLLALSSISPTTALERKVLLKDGVKVTMSSAEMEAGANSTDNGTKDPTIKRDQEWFKKNLSEIENANSEKDSLDLIEKNSTDYTINIDDDKTYQTFLGMGTSIDDSTVYNLSKMSPTKREEVIRLLIDPNEGAGMTLFRLSIGSSDYTREGQSFYSYYDIKGKTLEECTTTPESIDWYNETGKGFSIQNDIDLGIIDTIHMIQDIAKEYGVLDDIQFFASPWSIPGWMKEHGKITNGNEFLFTNAANTNYTQEEKDTLCYGLISGQLKDSSIDDAAMYFVRYLEEYAKEGIDIRAITLSNEPGQDSPYPNCAMTAQQEAKVSLKIKELLKDSNAESIKNTKIWAGDYNATAGSQETIYSGAVNYFKDMLSVDKNSFDGYAMHDYSAGQLTMDALKEMSSIDSSKELVISERSLWGTYGMNRIVQHLRNNAIGYCSWVTMLDSSAKSHQMMPNFVQAMMNATDPTLLIQETSDSNSYRVMPEVYMLGQFSKYIRSGDVRVDSTDSIGSEDYGISNVVFKNQETGQLTMVVVNNSNEDQSFTVGCDNYQFEATIEATNVATYQWNPSDIDTTPPTIEGQDAIVNIGTDETIENILKIKVYDDHDGNILFGDLNVETDYDPNREGTYTVKITATDKVGNTSTKDFTIKVTKDNDTVLPNQNSQNNQGTQDVINTNQNQEIAKQVQTDDTSLSLYYVGLLTLLSLGTFIYVKKMKYHK